MILLILFIVLFFLYGLASSRLERTALTAPMVFTLAGILIVPLLPPSSGREGSLDLFLRVAEIGLVLLLFTDASRTDLRVLRSIRNLPARLLSAWMLLTILLGALAARIVFPRLSLWEAGILSAILAPTDAGLGQVIVNSPRVPLKTRQALNVEAGLNDGLSVPFLLFFLALAGTDAAGRPVSLSRFVGEQLGLGIAVGAGIGLAGGWLLGVAHRRGWIAGSWRRLALLAVPLLCLLASEEAGASMFIAAFVAGLAVQGGFREAGRRSVEFIEDWGQLLNVSVFFLFGLLVARAWPEFTLPLFLYAVLSLTVVRMAPVGVALWGTGLSRATVLFMGWFGPRGLASIVLGLVYLQESGGTGNTTIRLAVMATVLVSIFAHGLSALPGTALYARWIAALPPGAPEREEPAP